MSATLCPNCGAMTAWPDCAPSSSMSETRERELVERLRNYHTGASWAAKPNAVMQSLAEAADLIEALSASTQVDAMREEIERLRGLENFVSCAENDVTMDITRKLFDLPDHSSAGRAALSAQPKKEGEE